MECHSKTSLIDLTMKVELARTTRTLPLNNIKHTAAELIEGIGLKFVRQLII
jgi:hypothetical protein